MDKDTQFTFLIRDIKQGVITHILNLGYIHEILRFSCHNNVLFLYLSDGTSTGFRIVVSRNDIKRIVMRKNEYSVFNRTGSDMLFYG